MNPETPFPELGSAVDPRAVPWHDAVVWSERTAAGHRVYEWMNKKDIRGVSWTAGLLSIEVSNDSFLEKDLRYILITAPFITIGKNVPL